MVNKDIKNIIKREIGNCVSDIIIDFLKIEISKIRKDSVDIKNQLIATKYIDKTTNNIMKQISK